MNPSPWSEEADVEHADDDPRSDGEIPRAETLIRLALTLLFALVAGAIRTVIALLVLFELGWTLVTRHPPGERVRELANRIVAYHYKILRYVTYNESRVPFPFSDFPQPLEPDAFRPEDRDSEAIGLPQDRG